MEQVKKQSEIRNTKTETNETMLRRILAVVFSLIEVILGFRFVFKLMGANPANIFVRTIYNITQFMVSAFASIFSTSVNDGVETSSIFEPGTLIAMLVVALIAWGISKLMDQNTNIQLRKTVYTENDSTFPKE